MGRTLRKRKRKKSCVNSNQIQCDNEKEVLELLQWLGIKTHLQLYNFTETGRGLRTQKNLMKGEVLISIPMDKMITRKSMKKTSDYPLHWSTQLMLSCFLIRESMKKQTTCSNTTTKSEWKIYLETLPQSYDVPYFDCPQDLLIYLPRHLKVSIEEQFRLIDTQFRELVKVLQEENFVSKKIFAWAWFTVNTRGVYFPDQHDNLALAPFLDMFNHSGHVQVHVENTDHFYNLKSSNNFPKHSQVFINYGPHDNIKLYLEYGFVIPDNPHDSVTFTLEDLCEILNLTEDTTKNLAKKLKFISQHQLDAKLQLVKNEELVSWSVLACLYILHIGNGNKSFGLGSPAFSGHLTNQTKTTTNNKAQCHYKTSKIHNENYTKNSEYLQVFELDLSWSMFKSELCTIANSLKNQLEVAKDKISTENRLNCQVLPKLLDIQHDICSFVVQRMLQTKQTN